MLQLFPADTAAYKCGCPRGGDPDCSRLPPSLDTMRPALFATFAVLVVAAKAFELELDEASLIDGVAQHLEDEPEERSFFSDIKNKLNEKMKKFQENMKGKMQTWSQKNNLLHGKPEDMPSEMKEMQGKVMQEAKDFYKSNKLQDNLGKFLHKKPMEAGRMLDVEDRRDGMDLLTALRERRRSRKRSSSGSGGGAGKIMEKLSQLGGGGGSLMNMLQGGGFVAKLMEMIKDGTLMKMIMERVNQFFDGKGQQILASLMSKVKGAAASDRGLADILSQFGSSSGQGGEGQGISQLFQMAKQMLSKARESQEGKEMLNKVMEALQ